MSEARRETAGVTTRLILAYVRRRLGADGVTRLLELAGETRPAAILDDEATWSTFDQKIALFDAAAAVMGDPLVARRIGESVLDHQLSGLIRVLVTRLGSPAGILRQIAQVAPKFSTVGVMQAPSVERNRATITYRVIDGITPNRHDCEYNIGLLSQAPALFGARPAVVDHVRCQVDGDGECHYALQWRLPRARWWSWRRSRAVATEADALRDQMDGLRRTATTLASAHDVGELLESIATRASSAVHGQRYLLAVHLANERRPRVHGQGVGGDRARSLGMRLLGDDAVDVLAELGPSTLVADIASPRAHYGRIAVAIDAESAFHTEEREALEAHAKLAAAALDTTTALAATRDRSRVAEALLALAGSLSGTDDPSQVATALAQAVPPVTGADRATVMLWDDDRRELRTAAVHGFDESTARRVRALQIRESDTPEITRLRQDPRPRTYRRDGADPFIRALLYAHSSGMLVAAPIFHAGDFIGVVVANWSLVAAPPQADEHLIRLVGGLADQGATAFASARLLEQARMAALHDPLTGLPNRALLEDRVEQRLAELSRDGSGFTVMFLDLDRFKQINDSLGHQAGDDLLRQLTSRLRSALRGADTLSRVGGDEFVLLLRDTDDAEGTARIAERLADAVEQPFVLDGRPVQVGVSIGAAIAPAHGTCVSSLFRRADSSMYAAKRSGATLRIWDGDEPIRDELADEMELRRALRTDELVLHYQPQYHLATGRLTGLEALVRWEHPERGLVPPNEFLPLAETTGLVVDLDLLLLRQACEQGAAWIAAGHPAPRIAVNLSGRTFSSTRLLPALMTILDETGYPPAALELELTETHLVDDLQVAHDISVALTDLGCHLAMDDAGTGYSTLSTLLRLPVARVKIDRSFVDEIDADGSGGRTVSALLALANRLGLEVVGEGVEDEHQRRFLLAEGCDEAQGYLFSRPLPPEAARALLVDAAATRLPLAS